MGKLEDLPDDTLKNAYPILRKNTPIRNGNARRKTVLRLGKDTILSNYGYAGKLDEGWSRQAPEGFTKPTIEHMKSYVKRKIGKI
jgi:hypothetical protein